MPNRFVRRTSASLNNQILSTYGSFAQGVANVNFTGLTDNRSSDAMLRRLRGHIWCRAGSTSPNARVEFGIMQEEEGVFPVAADFQDESKNLWSQECTASRDTVNNWDNPAFLHFDFNMSLKVQLGKEIYFSINNLDTITNFAGFVVRLFWSLI